MKVPFKKGRDNYSDGELLGMIPEVQVWKGVTDSKVGGRVT